MGFDGFIKIKGIDGESSDSKHQKWIEILSFSIGVSQSGGGSGSSSGTHAGGRADFSDFSFMKKADSASPVLAEYCCKAKPIEEITVELCRAMGDKTMFYRNVFKESIISSVQLSGSSGGDDVPTESVSIRFGEIYWGYTPTTAKGAGKKESEIKAGWSVLENEPKSF